MGPERAEAVRTYLLELQERLCRGLEAEESGSARFEEQCLPGERGGLARPRGLSEGEVFEKAAVHFSHTRGAGLPAAASARRPELAGRGFEALSVSWIVHPRNPHVPTCHGNLRFFRAPSPSGDALWWFGGGFDLTPFYPVLEDVLHWHRNARSACAPLGEAFYARAKRACDEYFFLPHRGETRGVGGLFFDDLSEPDFDTCFALLRSIGDHFLPGYLPLVQRRKQTPYGRREREFQLLRRGRYVEFNLLYDRGTRFGLEAGGRADSILASLPPRVRWPYAWKPEPGSPESRLTEFLRPRDWLAETRSAERDG